MKLENLAPWITIAITLALSILVPVFTQIANNHHQRKMKKEDFEYERKKEKVKLYEDFLSEIGALAASNGYIEKENLDQAGRAIYKLYAHAPAEWHDKSNELTLIIAKYDWEKLRSLLPEMSELIYKEFESDNVRKRKQQ